ncbi:MAG: hypothetical protein ACI8TX_002776 [Hyphomicrobiaceae bacterium]|jgi:hypothetical protein
MSGSLNVRTLACALVTVFAIANSPILTTGLAHAELTKQELKCSKTLVKSTGNFYKTFVKATAKCRDKDISGKTDDPGLCSPLDAKTIAKLDKARSKLALKAGKACASVCGNSTNITCAHDLECPPRGDARETCSGVAGSNPFSTVNLAFPGPYCDAILGHAIDGTDDIALCLADLAESIGGQVIDHVYGDVDDSNGLSKEEGKCVSALGKLASKTPTKIIGPVGLCRDAANGLSNQIVASDGCASTDEKAAKIIAKNLAEIDKTIDKKCTPAILAKLNLCGQGIGGITDTATAKTCVRDLLLEAADSQVRPTDRSYIPINLIDATHPSAGVATCGDGLLNGGRTSFNGVGEECEIGNDAACGSGNCFPPGDAWECTCDNIPRVRLSVDGEATDSDAGWTGNSHDADHVDGMGFTADVTNCDCTDFDGGTCVGTSGDKICDTFAKTGPTCSGPPTGLNCDEQGDVNGAFGDSDCFICDEDSVNAGAHCGVDGDPSELLCDSRCFDDETGLVIVPDALCDRQTDCAIGQTCRGRCDDTRTCDILLEGAPLPLVAASTQVCVQIAFFDDIVGTRNIETGEQEYFYSGRSFTHFGYSFANPCPTCEGTCDDDGAPCSGRCDVTDDACLTDGDCTEGGDTTCLTTTPDCSGVGAVCELITVCSEGPNKDAICRPGASTPFGIVSADCPMDPSRGITGSGTPMEHRPATTKTVQLLTSEPCTATGLENYDCPCPSAGGVTTKPNRCGAACDSGPRFAETCPDFSRCVGGTEAGAACDEDSDCDGGACTGTPDICTAGFNVTLGQGCTNNTDCELPLAGNGVCEPACPGGYCGPLCIPQGICDGASAYPGTTCAVDADCTGGSCLPDDPFDGACAAGPTDHTCSGRGFTGNPCAAINAGTEIGCELGTDGIAGTVDDLIGAGICRPTKHECFLNNGFAEGGDTLNGLGDATDYNVVSVTCTPGGVAGVNPVSGFGGPQRLRRKGTMTMNVDSIDP